MTISEESGKVVYDTSERRLLPTVRDINFLIDNNFHFDIPGKYQEAIHILKMLSIKYTPAVVSQANCFNQVNLQ